MNVDFLNTFMNESLESAAERPYLFIVDEEKMANNIILAGYRAVSLLPEDSSEQITLERFITYMDSVIYKGTNRERFMYVIAGNIKRTNSKLTAYFEKEGLEYRTAPKLLANKEYLRNENNMGLLKKLIQQYIAEYDQATEIMEDIAECHILNADGKPQKVIHKNVMEKVEKEIHFFLFGKNPYIYENGRYVEDYDGSKIKMQIMKHITGHLVEEKTINQIYKLLITLPKHRKTFDDLNNIPKHWVNFQNGFFNPISNTIYAHDPKYLVLNQLPYEYHPEEQRSYSGMVERVEGFLSVSIPDPDDQKMLWSYLGYCATLSTKAQKFLILVGEGGTGKSVVIHMFEKMIGTKNCAHIALQDLEKKFYATELFGKLLDSCGDIPCSAMIKTDVIKKAVGEDQLVYEKKGKDPMYFLNHAKFLFSANGMPENLEEKTNAFYRRLMILEMNQVIPEEQRNSDLKDALDACMSYIIHKAMLALHENMKEQKEKIYESKHSKEAVRKVQHESDSIQWFLDQEYVKDPGGKVRRSLLYQRYHNACLEEDRNPHGKKNFNKIMEQKGYYTRKSNGDIYIYGLSERIEESDFEPVDDDKCPFT